MSFKYATVCPHGFVFAFSTAIAPALIACWQVFSTSSVVNAISIPNGFPATLLSVNPSDKFVLANDIAANESAVSPVLSSAYSFPSAINFL